MIFEGNKNLMLGRNYGNMFSVLVMSAEIVHFLALIIVLLRFILVVEHFEETNNAKHSYVFSLIFIVSTMTTVGYGDIIPKTWLNKIYTMFLEFGGIILYGYLFQKIMIFINKSRNYEAMVALREEDLDSWLLSRERDATSMTHFRVIKKIQAAYKFIWKWDFDETYNNSFFYQLDPVIREEVSQGPFRFIVKYFSCFFKMFDYDDALTLANCFKPRL